MSTKERVSKNMAEEMSGPLTATEMRVGPLRTAEGDFVAIVLNDPADRGGPGLIYTLCSAQEVTDFVESIVDASLAVFDHGDLIATAEATLKAGEATRGS